MKNFTKAAIMQTFTEMLERMPFDKITISALTKECGISHNTFYYHYQDIYGLLDEWLHKHFDQYAGDVSPDNWRERVSLFLNDCKSKKTIVYHIFDSLSRDRLEQYVFSYTDNFFIQYVQNQAKGKEVPAEMLSELSNLLCYAFMGYFLKFLWGDMKDDVDEIVAHLDILFSDFISHAIDKHVKSFKF